MALVHVCAARHMVQGDVLTDYVATRGYRAQSCCWAPPTNSPVDKPPTPSMAALLMSGLLDVSWYLSVDVT